MSNLRTWQRLAAERAAIVALTAVELEEAETKVDMEKLIIADRYHHQAKRLYATAERKVAELSAPFERSTCENFPNPMPMNGPTVAEMVADGRL